jgi:UPF0716 protein FxsA
MFLVLLLVFVGGPILELYVASLVVDAIGFGPAMLILLAATIAGVLVIRAAWRRRPRGADSALLLTSGVLLLLPGYVSDVLGLILLLPPVRALVRVWLGVRVDRRLASWNLTVLRWDDSTGRVVRTDVVPGEVVEGEVVPDDSTGPRVVRGEIVDPDDPSGRTS